VFEYYDVDFKQAKSSSDGSIKVHENLKIALEKGALRIKFNNLGELATLDGSVYRAEEIIFRTPAEHTINGKKYDLEMQVVHRGQTAGDIAKQAILCFLFEKKPGVYNKFIDDIDFFNLPNPIRRERNLSNNIYIPKVFYNSESEDAALMKDFSFYTYQGSMTEPPCTERTIIYVTANPIPLGSTAIALFKEALRQPDLISTRGDITISTSLPISSRGIQKKNGRRVYYYDAGEECIQKTNNKPRKFGHYEKIPKNLIEYFYVSGPNPSHLPGAILVSKQEAKAGGDILALT